MTGIIGKVVEGSMQTQFNGQPQYTIIIAESQRAIIEQALKHFVQESDSWNREDLAGDPEELISLSEMFGIEHVSDTIATDKDVFIGMCY